MVGVFIGMAAAAPVRQASTPPIVTAAPVTTEKRRLGFLGGIRRPPGKQLQGRSSAPGGADAYGYRLYAVEDGGPHGRPAGGDIHVQGLQRQHSPGNQRA